MRIIKLIKNITLQINLGYVPSYSFGIKHSDYLGHFREVSTM
jgi:hypothetical protein